MGWLLFVTDAFATEHPWGARSGHPHRSFHDRHADMVGKAEAQSAESEAELGQLTTQRELSGARRALHHGPWRPTGLADSLKALDPRRPIRDAGKPLVSVTPPPNPAYSFACNDIANRAIAWDRNRSGAARPPGAADWSAGVIHSPSWVRRPFYSSFTVRRGVGVVGRQ